MFFLLFLILQLNIIETNINLKNTSFLNEARDLFNLQRKIITETILNDVIKNGKNLMVPNSITSRHNPLMIKHLARVALVSQNMIHLWNRLLD